MRLLYTDDRHNQQMSLNAFHFPTPPSRILLLGCETRRFSPVVLLPGNRLVQQQSLEDAKTVNNEKLVTGNK